MRRAFAGKITDPKRRQRICGAYAENVVRAIVREDRPDLTPKLKGAVRSAGQGN